MARGLIVAGVCAALSPWALSHATSQPANAQEVQAAQPETEDRQATVILHDGQSLSGTLVEESEEAITLLINGIRTTIQNRNIRETIIQAPLEDRYRAIRETIADDDAEQLIQLAGWLIEKGRNDLAVDELEGVLEHEPFNERARDLKVIAEQNLRLEEARRERPADREQQRPRIRPDKTEFPTLSERDINLMRVWEVDDQDPPRLRIDPETMESVFEKYTDNPLIPETRAGREAILRADEDEQLRLLFDLRAREFYPEVEVLEDPETIKRFRDNVHRTWLRNACATTACHGGEEAGRFRLIRSTSNTPEVYYTNLWIIEHYRTDEGEGLLDFLNPAESLLLKMALPQHETSTPHPEIPGWRPVFRSVEDRGYRRSTEWIESMWTPRPDYDIDYDPPTAMEPETDQEPRGR